MTHEFHTNKRLTEADRVRLQSAAAIVPKESDSREAAVAAVRGALLQAGLGAPTGVTP